MRLSPGTYEVDFDRDVSNCAYNATPVSGALERAGPAADDVPTGVFVLLTTSDGTPMDADFYLTVTC